MTTTKPLLPLSLIMDSVGKFLDRNTWNNLRLCSREMNEESKLATDFSWPSTVLRSSTQRTVHAVWISPDSSKMMLLSVPAGAHDNDSDDSSDNHSSLLSLQVWEKRHGLTSNISLADRLSTDENTDARRLIPHAANSHHEAHHRMCAFSPNGQFAVFPFSNERDMFLRVFDLRDMILDEERSVVDFEDQQIDEFGVTGIEHHAVLSIAFGSDSLGIFGLYRTRVTRKIFGFGVVPGLENEQNSVMLAGYSETQVSKFRRNLTNGMRQAVAYNHLNSLVLIGGVHIDGGISVGGEYHLWERDICQYPSNLKLCAVLGETTSYARFKLALTELSDNGGAPTAIWSLDIKSCFGCDVNDSAFLDDSCMAWFPDGSSLALCLCCDREDDSVMELGICDFDTETKKFQPSSPSSYNATLIEKVSHRLKATSTAWDDSRSTFFHIFPDGKTVAIATGLHDFQVVSL